MQKCQQISCADPNHQLTYLLTSIVCSSKPDMSHFSLLWPKSLKTPVWKYGFRIVYCMIWLEESQDDLVEMHWKCGGRNEGRRYGCRNEGLIGLSLQWLLKKGKGTDEVCLNIFLLKCVQGVVFVPKPHYLIHHGN